MLYDNNSAVIMITTEKNTNSQRHTKCRLIFSRQQRRERELKTKFLSNSFMLADIGTKNLDVPAIHPIINSILVQVPS